MIRTKDKASTREVGTSWGSFQIWIEGRNLCAHQEQDGHVDSVHWYLLPLIEWFARNWNPLLHEERLPVLNDGDTGWESLLSTRFPPPAIDDDGERASAWEGEWQRWWNRHALRSASEGGLFPDVVLRRLRDSVEISWGPARSVGMPHHFSFLEPGLSATLTGSGSKTKLSPSGRRLRLAGCRLPGGGPACAGSLPLPPAATD